MFWFLSMRLSRGGVGFFIENGLVDAFWFCGESVAVVFDGFANVSGGLFLDNYAGIFTGFLA